LLSAEQQNCNSNNNNNDDDKEIVEILCVQNKGMSDLSQCYVLIMAAAKKQQGFRRKKKTITFSTEQLIFNS